jgi:hypothetical protein
MVRLGFEIIRGNKNFKMVFLFRFKKYKHAKMLLKSPAQRRTTSDAVQLSKKHFRALVIF